MMVTVTGENLILIQSHFITIRKHTRLLIEYNSIRRVMQGLTREEYKLQHLTWNTTPSMHVFILCKQELYQALAGMIDFDKTVSSIDLHPLDLI